MKIPVRGELLRIQRVEQPRAVQVYNTQGITEEVIRLYFDNNRQSGGGDVLEVDEYTEQQCVIIVFKECHSKVSPFVDLFWN